MPRQDERALRRIDEFDRIDAARVTRPRERGEVWSRLLPVEFALAELRVLREVDEHRSGAAAGSHRKRFANCRRDVAGARHEVVVLGDRQGDPGDVGLLKRVGSDERAADLTGDADDG